MIQIRKCVFSRWCPCIDFFDCGFGGKPSKSLCVKSLDTLYFTLYLRWACIYIYIYLWNRLSIISNKYANRSTRNANDHSVSYNKRTRGEIYCAEAPLYIIEQLLSWVQFFRPHFICGLFIRDFSLRKICSPLAHHKYRFLIAVNYLHIISSQ